MMPWPSCKSKTKRKKEGHYLLAIVSLYQLDYISLFITTYVAYLLHCSSKNTVTALLEYLDLDCSIRVSRMMLLNSALHHSYR